MKNWFVLVPVTLLIIMSCWLPGCDEENTPPTEIPEEVSAVISVSDDTVYLGEPITFDGTESNGTGLSYHWDLDDGTTSTRGRFSRTYTSVGKYQVKLTVTDENGKKDTAKKIVHIYYHSTHHDTLSLTRSRFQTSIPITYPAQSISAILTYPSGDYAGNNLDLYLLYPNGTEAYNSRNQPQDPGAEQEEQLVVPFQVIAATGYDDWSAEVRYMSGLNVEFNLEITVTY